ncbi:SUZ domain-containing protein [Lentinula lateritia]|uniref:SUZ domain-containing protein n=1 Tax=Lentinula aff. lateritia TaxID=2804960 RepID=A0ACC1TI93_9AGAR|nr:SUZ domain-containing protein [Lentinula aff. lateritia]KAJ3848160.1 SUZ domain-containing protein [Lentinula lateritia]
MSFSDSQIPDVDPQILEALRSKDRIYVLRLGEIMEDLINEKKVRADLTAASSYQRLLLHRCTAYYKLQVDVDPLTKTISALSIAESRIPLRRLADLVPPEPTPQPAFKIMQRSPHDRRVKPQSHTGSVTGEDADSSDIEPSEAGSVGGRSSATGGSSKKRMTMEEREAAYNEARSRIFNEGRDTDMSASSSSVSVASSSAGGSSLGDGEDSVNSLATESERSSPLSNRRDNSIKSSGSRPLRSSAQPFTSSGSGSSRNSRAPSPAFTYASLYEPASSGSFDTNSASQQYSSAPFGYPYSAPAPAHSSPFPIQPYPYYYPYGPPPPSRNPSDPPLTGEVYPPPLPMMYNQYMWQGRNMPPLHSAPPLQPQSVTGGPPPPSHPFAPPPFIQHPPGYGYPTPAYYTPPSDLSIASQSHPDGQLYDGRNMGASFPAMIPPTINNGSAHDGVPGSHNKSLNHRASNGHTKPQTTPLSRPAWSYGPGISMGGTMVTMAGPNSNGSGETTGPRLHSMRRQSNTSNGSSSGAYRSSNSDEASSIASSSTSSSSRRTYTSTASSQHPLPPRPDWAVGLKPDPTLHSTNSNRHHDNSSRDSPVSPPRVPNGTGPSNNSHRRPQQTQPLISLQSQDFPPLTAMTTPGKRPTAGGVWTNPSRSVMTTPAVGPTSSGNALVHHPNTPNIAYVNSEANGFRAEDGFQRPPPRAAELYNPKMSKRSNTMQVQGEKNSDGRLNDQIRGLSLVDGPFNTNYTRTNPELSLPEARLT